MADEIMQVVLSEGTLESLSSTVEMMDDVGGAAETQEAVVAPVLLQYDATLFLIEPSGDIFTMPHMVCAACTFAAFVCLYFLIFVQLRALCALCGRRKAPRPIVVTDEDLRCAKV